MQDWVFRLGVIYIYISYVQKSTRKFSDGLDFSDLVSAEAAAASSHHRYHSYTYYIGITDHVNNNAHTYESTGKVLYPKYYKNSNDMLHTSKN